MICQKCNFQNEESAKFCRNCGVELGIISTSPSYNHNSTPPKQSSNTATWIMSVLFVLALGAFIFIWTQYTELDDAHNREQQKNIELMDKLISSKKGVDDLKRRFNKFDELKKYQGENTVLDLFLEFNKRIENKLDSISNELNLY